MAIICREHKLLYIQVPGTGCTVASKILLEQFNGKQLGRKHNDVPELLRDGLLGVEELDSYLVAANVRSPFDRFVTEYQRYKGPWLEKHLAWAKQDVHRQKELGKLTDEEFKQQMYELCMRKKRARFRAKVLKKTPFSIWILYRMIKWQLQYMVNDVQNILHKIPQPKVFNGSGGRFCQMEHLFPMLSYVDVVLRQEHLEQSLNSLMGLVGLNTTITLPRVNVTKGKDAFSSYYSKWLHRLVENRYHQELSLLGYEPDFVIADTLLVPLSDSFHRKVKEGGHTFN